MIQLKEGVKINGLKPEMLLGVMICHEVWRRNCPGIPFVITSVTEGKHGKGSLHYPGLAIDFRIRNIVSGALSIDQIKNNLFTDLVDSLGENYDVVLEETHFHIEYQPK